MAKRKRKKVKPAVGLQPIGPTPDIDDPPEPRVQTTRRAKKALIDGGELIISKSRIKAAVRKSNVSSDFYGALDAVVRRMIAEAETRALGNGRKTLRPQDL